MLCRSPIESIRAFMAEDGGGKDGEYCAYESMDDECTLYASHTIWESEADFRTWTESESFKKAHAQARAPQGTYLGHPVFEGFEAIL